MSKYKKLRLLESLIIVVIIISIIVIYLVFTKMSKEKPLLSNSEEVVNYKLTKHYAFNPSFDGIAIYNIPYLDRVIYENSFYEVILTSVDNYVSEYRENIELQYVWELTPEEKSLITNYCNSYDHIENLYSIRCKFKNNKIQINNLYFISKLLSQDLTIDNKTIHIPIDRKTKTSDYLNNIIQSGIEYRQLEE